MFPVVKRNADASRLHHGKSTNIHDPLLSGIVYYQVNRCSVWKERTLCLSREHILRIVLTVLHVHLISYLFRIRSEDSLYLVKLQGFGFESINSHLTIYSSNW